MFVGALFGKESTFPIRFFFLHYFTMSSHDKSEIN